MPYICCIFNTVVVVACVIIVPGFSPCRGYWVWVFYCLFVVCIYMLGWLCRATCYFVSTFQCLVHHLLSKWNFQNLEIAPPNEMKVHKKMTVSSRIYAAFWRALIGPKPFYCAITRELPVRSQGMCAWALRLQRRFQRESRSRRRQLMTIWKNTRFMPGPARMY